MSSTAPTPQPILSGGGFTNVPKPIIKTAKITPRITNALCTPSRDIILSIMGGKIILPTPNAAAQAPATKPRLSEKIFTALSIMIPKANERPNPSRYKY